MLTNPQILRIAAAELDDAHGKVVIPVGQHSLQAEITLRLFGTVEQLAEQEGVTPTVRIPLLSVLALVAERGGIPARRMEDLIVEAATEAILAGEPASEWIEHSKAAERRVKSVVLQRLPKVTRAGQLRRLVELSDVSVSAASLSARPTPASPAKRRSRAG